MAKGIRNNPNITVCNGTEGIRDQTQSGPVQYGPRSLKIEEMSQDGIHS